MASGMMGRRGLLAGGMALAAGGAVLMLADRPVSLKTGPGEIRTERLADGSSVALGPDTRIAVRIGRNERRVELAAGEIYLNVAHDADRPFLVHSGGMRVRVTGTRFSVSGSATLVQVAVAEGEVRVREHAAAPAEEVALTPGQRLSAEAGKAPRLSQVPPEAVGSWREGRLIYQDETLASVLADLRRFTGLKVTAEDPRVAALRLTASFPLQNRAVVQDIALALGLRVEQRGDQFFLFR
jgi:transmembrane sensor